MYHSLTTSEQGLVKLYKECLDWGIKISFTERDGFSDQSKIGSISVSGETISVSCFIPKNEQEIESLIDLLVRAQSAVEKEKQRILHLTQSPDLRTVLLSEEKYHRFNKNHNQNK